MSLLLCFKGVSSCTIEIISRTMVSYSMAVTFKLCKVVITKSMHLSRIFMEFHNFFHEIFCNTTNYLTYYLTLSLDEKSNFLPDNAVGKVQWTSPLALI